GVYVEEVPSLVKPIAPVATSIAGFVGVCPDQIIMAEENPEFDPTKPRVDIRSLYVPDKDKPEKGLTINPQVFVDNSPEKGLKPYKVPVDEKDPTKGLKINPELFDLKPDQAPNSKFVPWIFPAKPDLRALAKKVEDKKPKTGEKRTNDEAIAQLKDLQAAKEDLAREQAHEQMGDMAAPHHPVLCTSFSDFTKSFGSFSANPDQNKLAHGVYGFFRNGGTRCWVMRFNDLDSLKAPEAMAPFETVDEIALVAAPGIDDPVVQANTVDHCTNMGDRFAILDCRRDVGALDA